MESSKVIMPARLTAENGGKKLMIGEFFETIKTPCRYEVCTPGDCPICGGSGAVETRVQVTWVTIKEIYKKAVDHFGKENTRAESHAKTCRDCRQVVRLRQGSITSVGV